MQSAASPVHGERHVTIPFRVCDLRWRPCGRLVRFVAVTHPSRGSCVLMCTDTSLDAVEIIRLYGLRFKIEHRFKQAAHLIGSFSYHFWMQDMKPLARNSGDQFLHRESQRYRHAVTAKLHAYHVFSQADVICQGLLHYLSVACSQQVCTPLARGCAPSVPTSLPRNWWSLLRSAKPCRIFS